MVENVFGFAYQALMAGLSPDGLTHFLRKSSGFAHQNLHNLKLTLKRRHFE